MTDDNLTDREMLRQLQSQFSQLLEVVSIQYEAGDTKTSTLQRIAENQAHLGNQLNDHRHSVERRFDSLERDIKDIRNHDIESLKTDVSDHKKRIRGNGPDGLEKTVETLKKSYDSWVKWRSVILTALVVAVVGNTFVLVWSRITAATPQKTLAEQLDDEQTKKKLKEILAPEKSAADPKPEPQPEKPRDKKKRPLMPIIPGPGAQNKSALAKRTDHIANNRNHFPTISGKDFNPRLDAGIQTINPTEERKP